MGLGALVGLAVGGLAAGGSALIRNNQEKQQQKAIQQQQQQSNLQAMLESQREQAQYAAFAAQQEAVQKSYTPVAPPVTPDLNVYQEKPKTEEEKHPSLRGNQSIFTSPLGDTTEPYTGRRKLLGN